MWLFVFFDLPTKTKKEKKVYARFRKELKGDGFTMMQYSVYKRHCPSSENAQVHVKRVKNMIPAHGQVSIMCINDKQYGQIMNFWGKKEAPLAIAPQQLELF